MAELDIAWGAVSRAPVVMDYPQQNERRAGSSVTIALKNGVARNLNIQYGEPQFWYLSAQEIYSGESFQSGSDELRKREVGGHIRASLGP